MRRVGSAFAAVAIVAAATVSGAGAAAVLDQGPEQHAGKKTETESWLHAGKKTETESWLYAGSRTATEDCYT